MNRFTSRKSFYIVIIFCTLFIVNHSAFSIQHSTFIDKDSLKFTKYYYTNGKVSSEGYLRNGNPDGYWKTYNENGVIKSEGNRKNFELDSTWKFYNDSAKLVLEINYKHGKKNGIKRTHYKNGETIEENFVNDIKEGLTTAYFSDKKIHETTPFVDGREQGLGREYDANGNIIAVTEYKRGYTVSHRIINRKDKNGLKQGIWQTFYDDGNLHTEMHYSNDKRNGYYKEFADDGNLLKVQKYIDDVLQVEAEELAKYDIQTQYYPDGNVKKQLSYLNNKLDGMTINYNEDGSISKATVYKTGNVVGEGVADPGGHKEGQWKEYYDDGKLKAEGMYKNNIKVGLWKFYFNNGKAEQEGAYDDKGRLNGRWKWYFENGKLERDESYINGIENGHFIELADSGNVISEGDYVDGNKDGKWIYELYDYKEEGKYNNGNRDGEWKHYYKNGKLRFEGNYVDGVPNGRHVTYWSNGNIKEEGFYIVGLKQGDWNLYNEDGSLLLSIYFKDGIEKKYDGVKIIPEFKE